MPFCEVKGIPLFYSDQGQGECLVLLHGLGQNITSWENQIRELALAYRVVSLDLRGHGQSGDNEETITINLLAEDLAELLAYLEIKRVHLCGLSM
ncbi:MAG TPA: alpha/beta hydrolase, partial [Clostridia bacterium]|nr:alpha/beta hydrolase [Clostridia bacterium]